MVEVEVVAVVEVVVVVVVLEDEVVVEDVVEVAVEQMLVVVVEEVVALEVVVVVEDEVMVEYVFSQLEEKQHPDGKLIQIMMTGFLGKTKARTFMGELWSTLVEAQNSPHGIPAELIELKREEMQKKKVRARVKLATNRIFNSKAVICYEYQF